MIFGSVYLSNKQSFQKPFHENDSGSNFHFLAPLKSAIFILLLLLFNQQWKMKVYVSVFKFTFRRCNRWRAVARGGNNKPREKEWDCGNAAACLAKHNKQEMAGFHQNARWLRLFVFEKPRVPFRPLAICHYLVSCSRERGRGSWWRTRMRRWLLLLSSLHRLELLRWIGAKV